MVYDAPSELLYAYGTNNGKGVQANSVQCTVCKKVIHKRCNGVLYVVTCRW